MNKGNTTSRTIVYIILFLLFTGISILSFFLYNKGYGKEGRIKKEVTPIIEKFNSLKSVKENDNLIKAKFNKDRIKITYIIGTKKKDYYVTYNETADLKLLELQYDSSDTKNGEVIGSLLVEAVNVFNNNKEGEIFKNIKYKDLYNLNTKQGAYLTRRGNTITLMVNIKVNLLENIKDMNLSELDVSYITTNDINNINDILIKNQKYNYYKNNLILDVHLKDTGYEIYCSSKDKNFTNIYESIMSAVSILEPKIYDEIVTSNYDYNIGFDNVKFKLEVNPEIDRTITVAKYQYLMVLTIKK